jgi:Bacterial transcriptional activator domain
MVVGMAKTDVLDRVSADLAQGRTQTAIQRLSSLVAAHPTDLDLRRRLAAVYRRVGNWIEAGRWGYLTPGTDTAAFERAFPSPASRLAALRWPHHPGAQSYLRRRASHCRAPSDYARARLETLARAAPASSGRARWSRRAVAFLAAVLAAFFVVLGAVTVAEWLL